MVAYIHLSLTMYEIRLKTVLKKIEAQDYTRVQMLLDKYAIQPDVHILPQEVDEAIDHAMFMADIYCVVGQYDACKGEILKALTYLKNYRRQQLMMIKRLQLWHAGDDSLGMLAKLPWNCREVIGEVVRDGLFL